MSKDETTKSDLPFLSDRYVVEDLLGQGGMGVVYVARQKGLDRKVAIKVIHPNLDPRPALIARFEKEAKVYKELTHPNTVRIYDVDKTPRGHLFIVMEFLVGTPLDVLLSKERKFPPDRVAVFAKQVLKSLIEAHGHGIIHRDLKPANFMLCEQLGERDLVKVLDFGVASFHEAGEGRITKTGDTVGTPHYMSPEQVTGETLDQRSDLYSLGVSLFELATGQLPYEGSSPFQVAVRHASPDPIELPEWFAKTAVGVVTKRALNKDRDLRYSSSEEMLGHLEHLLLRELTVQSGPIAGRVRHPSDGDLPPDKDLKRRRVSETVVEDPLGTDETVAEVTFNIRRQQRRTRFLTVAFAVALLATAGYLIIDDLERSDGLTDTTVEFGDESSSGQTSITAPSPLGLEPVVTPELVSQPELSDDDSPESELVELDESESQDELQVAESDDENANAAQDDDDDEGDEQDQTDDEHDDGMPASVDDSTLDDDDAQTGLDQTVPPQDTPHEPDQQEETDHGDTESTTAPILH